MKLSIITINYNSSENTIKLLESLKNQTDKDFELIIVDNASSPADLNKLITYYTTYFPHMMGTITEATLIKNDRNLGYSGGNNIGIKRALNSLSGGGSDWLLLLNNDTLVESSFIEYLKANLEGKEGIFGLALDEGDRTAFGGLVQWLKPTLKHIYSPDELNNSKAYAIGGAILIHKNVFDKIGFLDENYFLYFEDADFCQKARKAGIPVSFISAIKIPHSVSTSTKKLGSPLLLRYHYRNALYFNLKNGPWYIKLLVWPWSWIIVAKQIIKIVAVKNREQSVAILKGVGGWYSAKMGKTHD